MGPIVVSTDKQILARMRKIGLKEEDIEESFVRSGGRGGQNVNKISSCVMLRHRPSGMTVKCQVSRHQGMNRSIARRILLAKLETAQEEQAQAAQKELHQTSLQNRKVSLAARSRNVTEKRRAATRRAQRRVSGED